MGTRNDAQSRSRGGIRFRGAPLTPSVEARQCVLRKGYRNLPVGDLAQLAEMAINSKWNQELSRNVSLTRKV